MDPFVGEIRIIPWNWAPEGWLLCNGQLVSISSYQALFSLVGTVYGGDGTSTFALPDLRSRVPIGMGQSPGLSLYQIGQKGGVENVTLTTPQLPAHTHPATFTPTGAPATPVSVAVNIAVANSSTNNVSSPVDNVIAVPKPSGPGTINAFQAPGSTSGNLGGVSATVSGGTGGITGGSVAVGPTGSNLPVPTLPPYLCLNFIIAWQGVYPSRP